MRTGYRTTLRVVPTPIFNVRYGMGFRWQALIGHTLPKLPPHTGTAPFHACRILGLASRSPASPPLTFLYGIRLAISNEDPLLLIWGSRQIVSLILYLGAVITTPRMSPQNHTTCTPGKPSCPLPGLHPTKWKLGMTLPFKMPNSSARLQLRSPRAALASRMRPKAISHSRRLRPHLFFQTRLKNIATNRTTSKSRATTSPGHNIQHFRLLHVEICHLRQV